MKAPWTRLKEIWRERRKPRQIIIYVMRADEMFVAHPDTDYTHVCHTCGEIVGIYPSTVELTKQYPDSVTLICNHCQPSPSHMHPLVPGAEHEIVKSKRRLP